MGGDEARNVHRKSIFACVGYKDPMKLYMLRTADGRLIMSKIPTVAPGLCGRVTLKMFIDLTKTVHISLDRAGIAWAPHTHNSLEIEESRRSSLMIEI